MEKAPTRAFSWLKAPTSAFTFKTLLSHYAKRALTPRFLNVKLGPRHNYHKRQAAIGHYANQTSPINRFAALPERERGGGWGRSWPCPAVLWCWARWWSSWWRGAGPSHPPPSAASLTSPSFDSQSSFLYKCVKCTVRM